MNIPNVPLHLSRLARLVARIFTQIKKYGLDHDPSKGADGEPPEIEWDDCLFADQTADDVKRAKRLSFRGLVFRADGDVLRIEARRDLR